MQPISTDSEQRDSQHFLHTQTNNCCQLFWATEISFLIDKKKSGSFLPLLEDLICISKRLISDTCFVFFKIKNA